MTRGIRGIVGAALLGALAAGAACAQSLQFTDAAQAPVSGYLLDTDQAFLLLTDAAADLTAGPSNDTTSVGILDIPGADTEMNILLTETATPGVFFGPSPGTALVFGVPNSGNGVIDAKDGDVLQAVYDPVGSPTTLNVTTTLQNTPTAGVASLLDAGLVDAVRYFLGTDIVVMQLVDADENRDPQVNDQVTVNASVAPGGDTEDFVLFETGPNTGVFRAQTIPQVGTANPLNGVIEGTSGATLTLAFADPEGGPLATDAAALIQVTASSTEVTDSSGVALASQPLPSSLFFVTVIDGDQNLDSFAVETVQVAVASTVTGDALTLTLQETTNSSGIFRNAAGVSVVQTAAADPGNAVLETENGADLTASYVDSARPTDTSSDTVPALVPEGAATVELIDGGGASPAFFVAPGDLRLRVSDPDQNLSASLVEVVDVVLTTSGTVGGDLQTVTLTETGPNTGVFESTAIPLVRDGSPAGENGTLEVLQGDTVDATYTDPTDAGDVATDSASINVVTGATADFVPSGNAGGADYLLGEPVVVEVVDADRNVSPFVAEVLNLVAQVGHGPTADLETLTLTETGPDTSVFRSDGALVSAVDPATPGNGVLEVILPADIDLTYTDPADAADVATAAGLIAPDEQLGVASFTDLSGTTQATYRIASDLIFVTLTDPDQNLSAAASETVTVTLTDTVTADVETLTLTETGADTGVFRNVSGVPSTITATATENGNLETGDLSIVTATYTDPDSLAVSSTFATMRVNPTTSVTSLTDGGGAVLSLYRIGIDPIFVTVTDLDENARATDAQSLSGAVTVTNLDNGDVETLDLTETGAATGVFRNTLGLPSSLPAGAVTSGDGVLFASDGDVIRATYTDDDDPADTSQDNAVMQFQSGSLVLITDAVGAQVNAAPILNDPGQGLFFTVTDLDQNLDPLVPETVTVTLRHVPPGAGEAIFGIALTETTSDSGVFRNTAGVLTEVAPAAADAVLQSFDGAQVQATYTDPNDGTDVSISNVTTLSTVPTAASIFITSAPFSVIQTTTLTIGSQPLHVTVLDADQDLSATAIDTVLVDVLDLTTGDSVSVTLAESTADSGGVFSNIAGVPLAVGVNAPGATLETAHLSTITANYADPTPGDTSLDFDSVVAVLQPSPEVVTLTNGAGAIVNPFLIGIDDVFVTVVDPDENTNGSSVENTQVVTLTSDLGDSETLSTQETSTSSAEFRSFPGVPIIQSAVPIPNNGTLEVDAGDQITATYFDGRAPGVGGTAFGISFVELPPATSITRFTDGAGSVQPSFLIGAGDIFVTVVDSDQNLNNSVADTVVVTLTVSVTGDSETGVVLTETGPNTGFFRNLAGLNSSIDPAVIDDGALQVAGSSQLLATYIDPDDPGDLSTGAAVLQVPQVPANLFRITTDASTLPTVLATDVAFIDQDLLFFVLQDLDQNTDPTTTETVDILVSGTAVGADSVAVRLVEAGPNSPFFINDGPSYLPAPVSPETTGLSSQVDPTDTGNFRLEAVHTELIRATYTDPDSALDTAETTVEMRIFERAATIFFSDAAGTPRATFPIDPLDPTQRVFVTLVDQDENLNASTAESVIVTLTDGVTGDVETVVLVETGPDTDTFRNLTGLGSLLLPAVNGDGVIQTGDLSTLVASYVDSEDATDAVTAGAQMVATQGASVIRLTDSAANDRNEYLMIPLVSEQIFVTVTDPDENKDPGVADTIQVTLTSQFNGDVEVVTLTETGAATGVFRTAVGTVSVPGCLPTTDGVIQGADGGILEARYTDTDDPLDNEFDLATLRNAPSFAAGFFDFIDDSVSQNPVTTFLIEDLIGISMRVADADENQDPCVAEVVQATIDVPATGDQEVIQLTETGPSTGLFIGPAIPLFTQIDPAVTGDALLQVIHPSTLEARYVDNDDISDQATASSDSVMFEEASVCRFIADELGGPAPAAYGIGIDRVFVEIEDRDEDRDFSVQESLTVTLTSVDTLDVVTSILLLETGNHTGIFRNIIPTPPDTLSGIASQLETAQAGDVVLQTSDAEVILLTYIDPTDVTDLCTAVADMELRPSTSAVAFTDVGGTTQSFYSIQFDDVFVTVTDLDQNADPTVAETLTATVTSLFASPATSDVEVVDLVETGINTGVFRNIAAPLPLAVAPSVIGDGTLQTADQLDIQVTYTDPDDAGDVATSLARTFVASANSTLTFTDQNLGGAVFQYFVGGNDIYVEVFDPDENISGTSTQSVVVTVTVTATGDSESIVLVESEDPGGGVVNALNSSFFRNPDAAPIPSVLAATGVPGNGVLEVIDGAQLSGLYVDNDFPSDTSTNIQTVTMRVGQSGSTVRLLDQLLQPTANFLVVRDPVVIEVDDPDQNGDPSVAESVVVTVDMTGLAFDQETVIATEIGPDAGIFRTAPVASVEIVSPTPSSPGNGVLEAIGEVLGGLGDDFFTVTYQDPDDGLDISQAFGTITTQVAAGLEFTDSVGTPKTTYFIGVDRLFLRLTDGDQDLLTGVEDTVIVTVTDFGTGDFEPVTLTETTVNSGVFTNPAGLPTVFDVIAIPGDGVLQVGDPSDETAQAEWLDPDDPADNQFDTAEIVPVDPNDRDGDGIPNGTETANGLDPNDPTDALVDNDLDGRDNRTELVVDGTDPNDDTDNAPVPVITPLNVTRDPGVVQLDGAASFDATTLPPNIGIVSFLWSQVGASPAPVSLSAATAANPTFVARAAGTYTLQLTVTDADGAQRSATTAITINDVAPFADPGPGGAMRVDAAGTATPPFQLDGSKSDDANGVAPGFAGGETLTFAWTPGPGNEVGAIVFDNPTSPTPRILSVTRPGRAVVRLTVTDTTAPLILATTADLVVLVHDDLSGPPVANFVPTANAGADQVVTAGPGVTAPLRGALSSDNDGEVLVLSPPPPADLGWVYLGGPVTGGVAGGTAINATATGLSQVGVYRFGLRVRDTHAGGAGPATSDQDETIIIAQTPTNHVPAADAGGPYLGMPRVPVLFDGTGSADADPGDILSFQWTQVAGASTPLDDPTSATPRAIFYQPGVYEYELVVTDLLGNASVEDSATVLIGEAGDNPPVAIAGADQVGTSGVPVVLDGTLSVDPENAPLGFYWVQTGGTGILLSDRRSPTPSFTPTRGGTYVFALVVDDGRHFSPPDEVVVSIDPPVAVAGPDQNLFLGSGGTPITVALDGSGSFDPTPGPAALTFAWQQVGGPTVTLSSPAATSPTFLAAVPGTYRFLLVVDDGQTESAQLDQNNGGDAFVQVIVSNSLNTIPTAAAGPDQFVTAGSIVTLDGSGSFDADGDPLTFLWTQITGNPVVLNPSATAPSPSFIPTVGGTAYTFRLTVTDASNNQRTDQVTVFATGGVVGPGGGNGLPGPTNNPPGTAIAQGGGGGGCAVTPLWVKGDWHDHWMQSLLNLLMFFLPLLSALNYRQRAALRVPAPKRVSQRL